MRERRRLTVSLVVTGSLANELDGLRRALGAGSLKRIAPHLTLVPPLNVGEEELDDVLRHVRAEARNSLPIVIELGPLATFWPRTPVLYLEVKGDLGPLSHLQRGLASGPLSPPLERKSREFVPHLTLDQRIEPGRLHHALEAMADYQAVYCFERVTILEQDADHRWWPLADAALGRPMVVGRGSLELELSVVGQIDPVVAVWANEQWDAYTRERHGPQVRPFEHYAIVARALGSPVALAEGEVRGSTLRLGRLLVSPNWRSQGAGSQLLRAVERFGIERGCVRVRLEVLAASRAQQFYEGRGFVVTARLPHWREDEEFVAMERALSPQAGQDL